MIEITKTTKLPKSLTAEVSPRLLAQATRVYLGNQRSGSAKTKTRSEVIKTTAKMYRQKGTGRARHGSHAAPIFVGGGIAFGPTGKQNYARRMSKYLNRLAILGALTVKAKQLSVVTGANTAKGKTTEVAKLIPAKTLVVVVPEQIKFALACRNLATVTYPSQLNAYTILAHQHLLMSQEALDALTKLYA